LDIHVISSAPLRAVIEHEHPLPKRVGGSGFLNRIVSVAIQWKTIADSRFITDRFASHACGAEQVRECCKLDAESRGYLEHAMEEMDFSTRAHDRILKVARTLADLDGSENIRPNDVFEAIQFRSLNRRLFE
jgi:magnesium chelatase family protein